MSIAVLIRLSYSSSQRWRLCDVAVFREQMFNTPPKPNRNKMFNNSTSAAILQNRLLAAAFFGL